jgi:predicted NAD/FAD-binding protein
LTKSSKARRLSSPGRGGFEYSGTPRGVFARPAHLLSRPRWRTVQGGSRSYVEAITEPWRDRIRLRAPVRSIERLGDGVRIAAEGCASEDFDQVVIATHSDQALAMLADPSEAEREILGAIPYQRNEAVLHTDASLLPRRRSAWASFAPLHLRAPRLHPAGVAAQAQHGEISGVRRTHYCGAYWGWGFHEDGVVSAIRACERIAPAATASATEAVPA